jgi:hypothetical protein
MQYDNEEFKYEKAQDLKRGGEKITIVETHAELKKMFPDT